VLHARTPGDDAHHADYASLSVTVNSLNTCTNITQAIRDLAIPTLQASCRPSQSNLGALMNTCGEALNAPGGM